MIITLYSLTVVYLKCHTELHNEATVLGYCIAVCPFTPHLSPAHGEWTLSAGYLPECVFIHLHD